MRVALLALVAAGAISSVAVAPIAMAQDAPAAQPAPEVQPAPAEPAVPTPAPDAAAAPAPDAAAAPAPEAPPAPPAPPPPPPVPTDPTSLAVLNVLERICLPLVKGGDLASIAKPLGFKLKKELWVQQYAKGYFISVHPQGSNPGVCNVDIDHPIDGITPVIVDLHNWAMARDWVLYRNDKYSQDLERTTRSWTKDTPDGSEAMVLVTVRKPGGKPMTSRSDHSELLYQYKAATPAS